MRGHDFYPCFTKWRLSRDKNHVRACVFRTIKILNGYNVRILGVVNVCLENDLPPSHALTNHLRFCNAMPLILPISGWSLFHLHLTSFSRVENENARLNSDLSSANLRWISNHSRQSLLRGLMKKNIADSAQIEYCITFHCSSVRPCVRHRRDISHFSHI